MRRTLEQTHIDLIVLDLMLPGEDGLKLCRDLRAQSQIPVLMLTALGEEIDRVLGLEVGADDYLPKPFSPRELVGRIKAILRRTAHMPRDPLPAGAHGYKFGDWQLDNTTRTLIRRGWHAVALTGAEFRLLSVLLSHAQRAVASATDGAGARPGSGSVRSQHRCPHQSPAPDLRDDARSPRIIKTIYGEGYVIGVPVEQNEATSSASPAARNAVRPPVRGARAAWSGSRCCPRAARPARAARAGVMTQSAASATARIVEYLSAASTRWIADARARNVSA